MIENKFGITFCIQSYNYFAIFIYLINVALFFCSLIFFVFIFVSFKIIARRRIIYHSNKRVSIKMWWNYIWLLLLLFFVARNSVVNIVECRSTEKQHTNLDILTADYLVMENLLWATINSGQNRENTLQHIASVHQMNFEQNFGEVGIFWDYFVERHWHVLTAMGIVNVTLTNCLAMLKNQKPFEIVQTAENITKQADIIYEYIYKEEFWERIRSVRFRL